jgi:hypothetical protein
LQRQFDSPRGSIVCDETHWPVVIITWIGRADADSVRKFFAWNRSVLPRADKAGGYVMITDASAAARPDADVRRLVAELNDELPPEARDLSIGNYVVITNPLIRGAMTAMQWVSRSEWQAIQVSSMHEAIRRSFIELDKAGKLRPRSLDPDRYVPPTASKSA